MSREPGSASTSKAWPGTMRALAGSVFAVLAALSSGAQAQPLCDAASAGRSSPHSRFVDNADGTVTDKESKLMWLRCSAGQTWKSETGRCNGEADRLNFAAAQSLASDVNQGGSFFFNDWRLPHLRELATIIERDCASPRVNLAVFPDTEAARFWTVTSRPGTRDEGFAYALSFGAEGIAHVAKDEMHRVRLVRRSQ